MVKMVIWRAFAGACRPNVAHFSVTPETAIVVFPPYSVSQENDKNKTNRTSPAHFQCRGHMFYLWETKISYAM